MIVTFGGSNPPPGLLYFSQYNTIKKRNLRVWTIVCVVLTLWGRLSLILTNYLTTTKRFLGIIFTFCKDQKIDFYFKSAVLYCYFSLPEQYFHTDISIRVLYWQMFILKITVHCFLFTSICSIVRCRKFILSCTCSLSRLNYSLSYNLSRTYFSLH